MHRLLFASLVASLLALGCERKVEIPEIRDLIRKPVQKPQFILDQVDSVTENSPLDIKSEYQARKVAESENATILVVQARHLPLHYHTFHDETVYVKSGAGTLTVGEKRYHIGPGAIMFIPRGISHSFQSDTEAPAVVISFVTPKSEGRDFVKINVPRPGAKSPAP